MNPNGVFIVPAPFRATANAFMAALGRGPDNLSVPCGPVDQPGEVTHYAATSQLGEGFRALLADPPPTFRMIDAATLDGIASLPPAPKGVVLTVIRDISLPDPDDPEKRVYGTHESTEHLDAVLAGLGLARVV